MTTKRKLIGRLVPCRCFRGEEEVISVLDYSHCSLQQVPKEIFSFERTLEELYLDANQIEELPKQLFNCQALRKLSMPDNDLSSLPATIASLVNLKELDISKNGIQDFPDNIKCCKCLTIIEASVNPIAKLPDGFTQLLNLMQLYLNDAFLEYLPANFGRLTKLRILELRENHLKTLPKSIHRLTQLERLDLGNNEFTDMPEVLEQIQNLKELWMDNNGLQTLPGSIGKLKQLTYLDMSKNRVETIDSEISGCEALEDLLLSSNMLQQLPDSIGMLKKLTTLKVDDNQLTALPNTIGSGHAKLGLSLLEEFDCSCNELESLPPTIGYLHNLRTLAADENFLSELPREIGSCKNVTVMSLRSNKLEFLPEEIGQMQKLRVLNLSDNRLRNLPFSFTKLKELAALWLSDNQSKALIPLQSEAHPETKLRVLTNYMFPQQPRNEEDYQSDNDSFNPTLWEEQRQQRMTVAFDFEDKKEEEENSGKVKVEINLKRYPTPYPEDLKNMVKSVQNLVGKTSHALTGDKRDSSTNMELQVKDKYEHKWPISTKEVTSEVTDREANDFQKTQMTESSTTHNSAMEIPKRKEKDELTESSEIALHRVVPKQQQPETLSLTASCFCLIDSLGGSPNDIRISDMRPTLVEPPLYKPKVVLMGKEKKESTDESDTDKMHCPNNSGSSATYSDYSPSQGSSGSSNPPGNVGALQTGSKDGVVPTHWTNRLAQSFPQPIETKPLLSQRESAPAGIPQQRNERHPLTDTFDNWNDGSHYDNTGFVAEETGMENSGSAPMLGSNSRSASTHGRRPLMRQDRIVGVPLELEQTPHTFHNVRNTPETEVPAPNPWQNWTRTPSPFEDRTAFPSKLESTPASSPAPDRKDFEQEMGELPGTFPSTGAWGFLESRESGASRSHSNIFHCRQDPVKGAIVISKSTERLSPMMKEVKAKFKKSQSIDEIDIGSYKVYSIPLDNYGSSTENQGSLDKPETQPSQEQSMSRSQSVPMLDEDLEGYASGKGSQQQKPPIPKKVYHFDQSFNPKGAVDVKSERRLPTSFNTNPEYMSQQGKNIPKEVLSPRGYRGYTPMEHMFSFSQPSVNEDSISQQFPSQRSRPGFLRRADSLVSSTEMALFRRVTEAQELPLNDRYNRTHYKGMLEHQNSLSSMAESQFHKRNGRYEDEYSSYQETKKPITGFPVKNLTQRRPLSARSYSTESYGASQARPVSARPTMAALLEKVPSDYNLSTCTEKTSDNEMKMRTAQMKGDESSSKMPVDWRQQLLRHIEAKRLDRNAALKHNTVNLGNLYAGRFSAVHANTNMTLNFDNNPKHEYQKNQHTPSQQSNVLDNGQEDASPTSQWAPYSLGRRDIPPENVIKKLPDSLPNGLNYPQAGSHSHQVQTMMVSSTQNPQHRSARDQQYEGAINKISIQQYQSPLPIPISSTQSLSSPRGAQSGRCLIQTKGQKSMDGYQDQFCVRIEKNPGLGFSITGGISGQGNPFKPSDMGIFVTRVQPDGSACNVLQPGDKILKANGHSFSHLEHEKAVSLLKSFPKTVDLVILRENPS
ncbi:leucine-rich repeat-containing protein 7-like isoform X2 [Acipenser ruthenus]|nr:leucine-rich repeat-containing protein 7-like isoform X2 [Acipenser ruthenus]XP_058887833.1 leucine-rich repeat-containing protein 7-like isoform X2 [Acipenser ruthenus]XP_058887834.1 leucine-rich repeat-containing protein 7-like isoform X2 [Acipenser ruthenus]